MDNQSRPQPTLLHGRRNQKFGRYDFERFDHLSSSPAIAGYGTFHKVNVNCRFLFKKSRWGVLGENKNPAGIIYLDLTFDQPKDCRLHSATVIVTLDDKDDELHAIPRPHSNSYCPVNITDYYGPKGFAGEEKSVFSKKSLHFTPSAQFGGIGFGGLGFNKQSTLKCSSRWKFSGNLQGKNSTDWTYKTLKWELSENDLETESTHSNEVHTAFTFEHGGQPFFMRVEIQGKLKKLHARVKNKLMKFPSTINKEDGSVVTLISFGNRALFQTPLDKRAEGLAHEMEMANLEAIQMEVPDPKPVSFSELPQNSMLSSATDSTRLSGSSQPQPSIPGSFPTLQLPESTPQRLLQNAQTSKTDPTLANLARAFVDVQTMIEPSREDKTGPMSPTLAIQPGTNLTNGQPLESIKKHSKISEEQAALQLLKVFPGILIFLRMVVGLLGYFGQTPAPATESAEENEIHHTDKGVTETL